MEHYTELKEHFEKLKEDESYIDYFYRLSKDMLRKNPSLAKEVIEGVLLVCKENKYEIGYAWALLSLGWHYQDICRYDEAIDCHSQANNIFTQKNILEGMARTNNALLADYTALGMFDLAIEHGLLGISIAEKYGYEESLIPLVINTAMAYLDSKYYNECTQLIKRLEYLWNKISSQNKAIIYNMLAEVEIYFEDFEKANEFCENAYNLINKDGLIVLKNENRLVKAEINWKTGNYEEADLNYEEALRLSQEFKNQLVIQKILISWSKYYIFIGKYEEAEKKLLSAIEEGKRINSKISISEAYCQLSILYENTEKYKEAYESMKKVTEYERDVFNHNSSLWFGKLHNKKITEEAKAYKFLYDEMKIISNIGRKITSNLNKESTLEAIYKEVNLLVDADVFGIALYYDGIKSLDYEYFVERGEKITYGLVKVNDKNSFGAYCYNNKIDLIINDIENDLEKYIKSSDRDGNKYETNAKSAIFCPLMIDNKVIGILSVQSYKKNMYTSNDLNKLKILTSYIVIALQNAMLYEELEFLATHDGLTGVLSRSETLNRGISILSCYDDKNYTMGIIMLDIDHFKKVNDNYGHISGDCVLIGVADIIKSEIRNTDYIGRYGGEEFLILLPGTSIEDSKKIGERIRIAIERSSYEICNEIKVNITCSIGVCGVTQKDSVLFFDAIKFADEALYKAKELGRNRVIEYKLDKKYKLEY